MKTTSSRKAVQETLLKLAPYFHVADGRTDPDDHRVSLPRQDLLLGLAEVVVGDEIPAIVALRDRPAFLSWFRSVRRVTPTAIGRWMKMCWVKGEVRVTGNNFAVAMSWIGEGLDGDFSVDRPEDTPLLRFDLTRIDDIEMQDASFCTQIPVTVGERRARELAKEILDIFETHLASDATDGGRLAQRLSWIDRRGIAHCQIPDGSVPC